MPVRLKSPQSGFPPNGFRFSDPHTGKLFDDQYKDMFTLVREVLIHRKANPRIYPESNTIAFDLKAIEFEITVQLCATMPQLCEDDARPGHPYPAPPEKAQHPVVQVQGKVCAKCGGKDFQEIICSSCGGRRVGYKCNRCGLET